MIIFYQKWTTSKLMKTPHEDIITIYYNRAPPPPIKGDNINELFNSLFELLSDYAWWLYPQVGWFLRADTAIK